ncbi:MAG TPA: J domain-containing protein, partial [Candidatus Limnocylindrales bacterium]|nr:J domain-containing protein [Candidatus Limnocylindrales bacterium]
MTPDADPHRTLGLSPDASAAEIKAAYRRLAKAFHPDTAGEAAIPRFLAIRAAYEQLTGASPTSDRAARDAWRADPERARAAREAWRARRSGGGAAAGGAGGGARSGTGEPETNDGTGAWREKRRDGGAANARRSRGTRSGEAGPRSGARGDPAADRAPDRATPGSTTYDFAEQEPFDPEWSGASWYGTTSGTYWTINPREYADPRKHGPEYQARARRRSDSAEIDEPDAPGRIDDEPLDAPAGETSTTQAAAAAARAAPAPAAPAPAAPASAASARPTDA